MRNRERLRRNKRIRVNPRTIEPKCTNCRYCRIPRAGCKCQTRVHSSTGVMSTRISEILTDQLTRIGTSDKLESTVLRLYKTKRGR